MKSRWLKALGEFCLPWIAVAMLLPAGVMVGVQSDTHVQTTTDATLAAITLPRPSVSSTLNWQWCGEQKGQKHPSHSVCPFKLAQGFLLSQAPLTLASIAHPIIHATFFTGVAQTRLVVPYQAQAPPSYS